MTRHCRVTLGFLVCALMCLPALGRPAAAHVATGAGPGGGPHVRQFDPLTGAQLPGPTGSFFAYAPAFPGGVRIALCDLNGDGVQDIVTAAGQGGGPHIKAFDGVTGALRLSFFAYAPTFTGGAHVACADVNGDGTPDIVTGAGPGGGPHVRSFDGATGVQLPGPIGSFFAYDAAFPGGVRVAAGDVNGDGKADIVTGAGAGGGPHVKVFDGATMTTLASFFAYAPTFTGGVYVAAGDVNGDGKADIITGAGPGGGPHVKVFNGANPAGLLHQFFAYDPTFPGGVRVAAGDVNGDGKADIITGAGPGGGPHVKVFDGVTLATLASFFAYAPSFTGGVFVAAPGVTAATITSADNVTFTVGTFGTFTVTTIGSPPMTITQGGTLPLDVTFTDNGDGTATLEGIPQAGTGGPHNLTFTADNGVGSPDTQNFTLTVNEAPTITSAAATTFVVGTPATFTINATGFPGPVITSTGAAPPSGVTFTGGTGTATLDWNGVGNGGSFSLQFTASNGVSPDAVQNFTLTINQAPAFTSPNTTTFTVGTPASFPISASGFPSPAITNAGATPPSGVTFVPGSPGTASLSWSGTGSDGFFPLQFTASNGVPPNAVQDFTLRIRVPLVANNDTYPENVVGNVSIDSSVINFSVLANDSFSQPMTLTSDTTSANGGTVTMITAPGPGQGQFTYNPPVGFTGADTFTYTLNDGVENKTATVTLTVSGMIWFVNNNAGACPAAPCDGRLSNPFTTLASFQSVNNGGAGHPGPNQSVFVYESGSDYAGPVALLAGQKLIGQDATDSLASIAAVFPGTSSAPLPATSPGGPSVTLINGVVLNANNTLRGFTVGAAPVGISGNNFGTLVLANDGLADVAVNNASGPGLDLSIGTITGASTATGAFTSVTATTGLSSNAVNLFLVDGAVNLGTGALSGTLFLNGGSANVTYVGTISTPSTAPATITGKSGGNVILAGLVSGTGGGITLAGNNNPTTITFAGGVQVAVPNNTVAFDASAGGTLNVVGPNNTLSSGLATALRVENVTIGGSGLTFQSISAGASGSVTGSGIVLNNTGTTAGLTVNGGTIQNTTSHGILLTDTQKVVLNNVTVQNTGDHGIHGSNVTDFTFNGGSIFNFGNNAPGTPENGMDFTNLTGTVIIRLATIGPDGHFPAAVAAEHDGIRIVNTGTNPSTLTMSVTGSTFQQISNDGIDVQGQQSDITLQIFGNGPDGQNSFGPITGRAITLQDATDVAGFGTNSDFVLSVHFNTFTNVGVGARWSVSGGSSVSAGFTSNTMTGTTDDAVRSLGDPLGDGFTTTVNASITDNTNLGDGGILVASRRGADSSVYLKNNDGIGGFGILAEATRGGILKMDILNNTVVANDDAPHFAPAALYLQAADLSLGIPTPSTICANVSGNNLSLVDGTLGVDTIFIDNNNNDGSVIQLEGWDGVGGNAGAQLFLTTNNVLVPPTVGFFGSATAGVNCLP